MIILSIVLLGLFASLTKMQSNTIKKTPNINYNIKNNTTLKTEIIYKHSNNNTNYTKLVPPQNNKIYFSSFQILEAPKIMLQTKEF